MSVLLLGLALPLVAFAIHVARWRHGLPNRPAQTLIVLMVGTILAGWTVVLVSSLAFVSLRQWTPGDVFAWIQALLLALAMAAAYVMTYPAIEVESPTLLIIEAIGRSGAEGIPESRLFEVLDDSVLLQPRLDDLVLEGLAVIENGRYRPTAKGIALATLFTGWRRILGLGLGG